MHLLSRRGGPAGVLRCERQRNDAVCLEAIHFFGQLVLLCILLLIERCDVYFQTVFKELLLDLQSRQFWIKRINLDSLGVALLSAYVDFGHLRLAEFLKATDGAEAVRFPQSI